ncbi:MAG TPA: transglutaminaseTgpA domain-containing protein, partial [Ornithinibacter sp.]|nr:transglutaminaseTgpA domain-containing protein [Ornithinibacter sp.]HPV89317.1 transglutaminaseTgpA domain-containing protein [Ornithinibacter sp.]
MNRARPIEALLAVLATIAVTIPVTTLFTPNTWMRPSLVLVAVVAVTGAGLRTLTSQRPLVVLGQGTALVYAAALLHGRGHLWADLVPTPETGRAFGILLTQAGETVTISAAPAPSNRGTILAISLLVGLTALAVDAIGVTYRSPALAGIPLLAAFLGSATNSGDGLASWYVIPTALCWLALMGRQSVGSLRAWGTPAPRAGGRAGADPSTSFATTGRIVGVAALAAAVVVPTLIPHLPTTFIADGLGQSSNGR